MVSIKLLLMSLIMVTAAYGSGTYFAPPPIPKVEKADESKTMEKKESKVDCSKEENKGKEECKS